MSDLSDPEEFYDAEEQTPVRLNRPPESSPDDLSIDLDAEERRLEEEQQLAEERRRQEDEALKRKFEELQLLKEKQKQKEEALLQAQEHERRRRKLQEMRQHMSDESNPRPPPKPPRLDTDVVPSEYATPSLSPDDTYLSATPTPMDIPIPSIHVHDATSSTSLSNPSMTSTSPGITSEYNFNQPSEEKSASALKNFTDLTTTAANSSPSVAIGGDTQELSEKQSEEEDLVARAVMQVGIEDQKVEEKTAEVEPDIILSVKSSSLGREVSPLPVAPPRKKRKNKGNEREGSPSSTASAPAAASAAESSSQPTTTAAPSAAAAASMDSLETPTSTVYSLTKELERSLDMRDTTSIHSLDIMSATKGKRIVTAMEEASSKAEDSASENIPLSASVEGESTEGVVKPTRHSHVALHTPMQQIDEEQVRMLPTEEVFSMMLGTQGGEVPLNMMRPRSNSGTRFLSDKEILDQVTVLNLDTGEQVALSRAEDKIPRCINPLSLHIMRRTKEYSSDSSLHKQRGSDEEDTVSVASGHQTLKTVKPIVKKGRRIKKIIGKTAKKLKLKADGVLHGDKEAGSSSDDDEIGDGRRLIKVKASHSHKGPYDFDLLVPVQDIAGVHVGAVWTMKFSLCGRLLATGGQDNLLRVWVLKDHFSYFEDMKNRYNEATKQVSPAPSQDSLGSVTENVEANSERLSSCNESDSDDDWFAPFRKRPLQVYNGHQADVLDVSWSKNYFLLSASMDKTVRLWHVSRGECLCCFQHIDFVTAIAFHPKDDRYFLSGSLDGKLRLWSIPDKKVALWNEVSGHTKLITAANFCLNGEFAVVGTYDGRCVFYNTKQLKYFTQIHVRSTRGKNARGRKITGIEPLPGEDKILVTSNDSRIRLYDLRDLTLTCKFKGCANNSSQIKACFSHDGRYIVCGSEDHFVYIWQTQHEFYKFSSARRDRSDYWEGIKAHNAVVTSAIFAPIPKLIIKPQFEYIDNDDKSTTPDIRGEILVSADYNGTIKVFINKFKPNT